LHQLHAKFLVRHFAATELKLHTHFVALIKKFFAVANFCQVIVVVDVNPKLDFFELCSGRLLILVMLGEVVTELAKRYNLANRRVCSWRDFNQIEAEALSLAQGIGQFQDAELFAVGT